MKTRLLLLQAVIIAVILVGAYFICRPDKSPVALLQSDTELRCSNLLTRVCQYRAEGLADYAADYSLWDEMVAAVKHRDTAWCRLYVPTSLRTYGFDAAWLCDTNFSVIYSAVVDSEAPSLELPAPVDRRDSLFSFSRFRHYFWYTYNYLLEVEIAPVQHAVDTERKTPASGFYVVAKLWNQSLADDLSLHAEAEISVALLDTVRDTWYSEPEYGIIRFADSLRDWRDHPIALIRGQAYSRSLRELQTTAEARLWLLVALGVLLMASFWLCIRCWMTPKTPPQVERIQIGEPRETLQP